MWRFDIRGVPFKVFSYSLRYGVNQCKYIYGSFYWYALYEFIDLLFNDCGWWSLGKMRQIGSIET